MQWRRTKTYGITPDRDEWVAPEETLVDASSTVGDVELPVGENIFRAFSLLTGLLVLVLVIAVGYLTLVRHAYFSQMSLRNRTVNVSVPPPRGIILDRDGFPLVRNVPSFDILVVSRQVRRNQDGTFVDVDVVARALERNPEELALMLSDNIKKNAVFFLATDISRPQVLTLKDSLPSGFSLITSTKRQYTDGPQFAQLIGYVGKVSREDMVRDPYYLPSDTIGRLGVEAQYEETLRGAHGQLVFTTSQTTAKTPPTAGGNVVLSVDAKTQKALWNAVRSILLESGLSEAAAIAQDPRDGSVLAMVSFPTYDNNVFNGQLSQQTFDELFASRQRPLFNRVISGLYNPGSTIKPMIGMSALQEGVVHSNQMVTDNCISISVPNPRDPENPYVFKNWRPDTGPFDLRRAIANSCNIYFFTVGGGYGPIHGLGIERIVWYLQEAFVDRLFGIDLPGEEHGFIPTPTWKYATKKEPWYQGDTYNISIGQGDLLVTPLWMNSIVSAIANGGTLWEPRVVGRTVDDQKNTLQVFAPRQLGNLPFDASVIRTMQEDMRATVTEGTAHILKDLPVSAAAKTGTAEVIKGQRINSLLTVWAPVENPQIALTVLVEGSASNQGYALRAAKQFLEWYFGPGRAGGLLIPVSPTPAPAASVSATPALP